MNRAPEIIDPTGKRRLAIGRRIRRIVLPILGVTLVVAAMAGVGFRSYVIARGGVQRLSRALLVATQDTVAQEMASYLVPATQGQAVGLDMVQHGALTQGNRSVERFAAALMRQDTQVTAFYFANSDGNFELVQRTADGGTDLVAVNPADNDPKSTARVRTATHSNAAGQIVSQEAAIPSSYDPRRSAYYRGAMGEKVGRGAFSHLPDGSTVYWSTPYLYKPTDEPVISASIGYTDPADHRDHVLAVNLALDRISAYLGGLKIGEHGKVMIVDRDGQVIASPSLANAKGDPRSWRLDRDGADTLFAADRDLRRAFDMFRVQGFGPQAFTMGHDNYISLAAPLPNASPDWVLLLVVPARDFAAFSAADTRSTAISLLIIIALAGGLAGVLVWQGIRSDRLVGLLDARNARGVAGREAVRAMLGEPHLLDPSVEAPALTERLATAAGAARAGIWRLVHDGTALRCDDLYDARADTHAGGTEFRLDEEEDFADARLRETGFGVVDAAADPRTQRFFRQVMRNAGTRGLHALPVAGAEGPAALLLLEDAKRIGEGEGLVDMIGGIVALRLRAGSAPARAAEAAAPGHTPAVAPAVAQPAADRSGDDLVFAPEIHGEAAEAGLFPAVAVMVLSFSDTGVEQVRHAEQALQLVGEIAAGFQDIARRHGLFSVKVAGHRLVAAAGCSTQPDPDAAPRLALAALEMRDLCLSRLSSEDIDPAFQIGIDVGPTFGAPVGTDPVVFNLWGETVRIAEAMAQANALPGSIQVTEAVHAVLRDRFLFRTRGSFYTPRRGATRAYVLAGRQ